MFKPSFVGPFCDPFMLTVTDFFTHHRQGIACVKSVNRTPLPLKVSKFGLNYTFSGGNFPVSTVYCHSLSVPNVSQTYKLINNTLTGPEGHYKLLFKN